ncbi:MAG: nucleoside hydrolase [Chloroflexi bacterium]|nr:nucleoside hydrolase [Chloroflexota bacterium]
MDVGVDDSLAILLALRSPELEILGITAVAGNAPLENTANNTLRVLEAAGRTDIPVARGAAKPLTREPEAALHVHGNDGLGGSSVPQPTQMTFDERPAVQFISDIVIAHEPGEITLIPTGPMTNVAHLMREAPDAFARLKDIVLMGGAFALTPYGHGNVTTVSEFNIWADPEAAAELVQADIPITAIGLDVTTDPSGSINSERHQGLGNSADPYAKLAAMISVQVLERFGVVNIHDAQAVAAVIDPSLFRTETYPIEIITQDGSVRGQTIVDRRPGSRRSSGPEITVATDVDGPRFLELLLGRLTQEA